MLLENIISVKNILKEWVKTQFLSEKLNNPLGFLILTTVGLVLGSIIPYLGIGVSSIAIIGIVALPLIAACMFYHQFGVIFTLIVAFFVNFISRIKEAPIGTAIDGLLVLMIFGILIGQIVRKDWKFAKDPISTWLLIWIYYNLFEVLNPAAESKLAWLFTVRSLAILNLLYFIACYSFTSLDRIKQMLHVIIGLAMFTALYGIKQEFFGMTTFEKAWLYSDPERFQLFFQWGRMRVFSILSDAMTFGIMMAYMGTFCFIYSTAPMKSTSRAFLIFCGVVMFWVSAYSGTRTCFALIPLGFVFYALMTLSRNVAIASSIFILLGAGLMLKSTGNAVVYRIQSSFKPSEDASVQIRYFNQQRIRPHIYSHPIGFGLGSTGLWARRFTPDSFLAGFAHDSYYVRLAVEEGWIGMALYMFFLYTVLRRALFFYLRTKDPTIKTLYLALMSSLFMLSVANYPQEAIVQLPTSLVVYIFFAAIVRLKDYDEGYQAIASQLETAR
jgi:putative inorganic carbon (hco3(-)) transporter